MSKCKHDWRLFGTSPGYSITNKRTGDTTTMLWYCTKCRYEDTFGNPVP